VSAQRFTAELHDSGRGGGRWIEVQFDARAEFGEARAPVKGTVNGTPLRSRFSVYCGKTYLGLTREVREAAGIQAGDQVTVWLERDDVPRVVEVPPALAEALAGDERTAAIFNGLAFTHRKEYARWITDAKADDTRNRRVAKAIDMLRAGVKHP